MHELSRHNGSNITIDRPFAELQSAFPNGGAEGLFPFHFLQKTFPAIGGRIVSARFGNETCWGLLMSGLKGSSREWTLRSFLQNIDPDKREAVASQLKQELLRSGFPNVYIYDYEQRSKEEFQGELLRTLKNGISLGTPNFLQAQQARKLQREIWGSTDNALYPADLYHPEAGLPTRFVATKEGELAGFLMGYYGYGKKWWGTKRRVEEGAWIESQLMGVSPRFRGQKLSEALKFFQREQALAQGIDLVNWTVDPLQWTNAGLNLNALGAIALRYHKNYYDFQNDINKVPASRLEMTWLLNSPRVKNRVTGSRPEYNYDELSKVEGTKVIIPIEDETKAEFNVESFNPEKEMYLVRIPDNWNQLQNENLDLALRWRTITDGIFAKLLIGDNPTYAITGAVEDGKKGHYLLIRKISPDLGV